jgi:hypothetical protein
MAGSVDKPAWLSVFAYPQGGAKADIPMTAARWAELFFTSLGAIGIAFLIIMTIGMASAQETCHSPQDERPDSVFCFKPGTGI